VQLFNWLRAVSVGDVRRYHLCPFAFLQAGHVDAVSTMNMIPGTTQIERTVFAAACGFFGSAVRGKMQRQSTYPVQASVSS
jgi:hypothetical protein